MGQPIASGNKKPMKAVNYRSYRCFGFTYLALLFFIAALGIGLSTTGVVWHKAEQRTKEDELLFYGDQIRRAIGLYYDQTPGTIKQYPKSLGNLLTDNRHVTTHHYLRKIYRDPMTGKTDWGLVTRPDGGITGVYSKSELHPIKASGFKTEYATFKEAKIYQDWKFVHVQTQIIHPSK